MNNKLLALRQIDKQLLVLTEKKAYLSMPGLGWIRTLRKALGMTTAQLARRLGVDRSRVIKIESDEVEDAVTLKTLKKAANALDCVLVYNFVPKQGFEDTIRRLAKEKALLQIKRTSHTMDLEAQSVDQAWLDQQVQELTETLLRQSWKHLWEQ